MKLLNTKVATLKENKGQRIANNVKMSRTVIAQSYNSQATWAHQSSWYCVLFFPRLGKKKKSTIPFAILQSTAISTIIFP